MNWYYSLKKDEVTGPIAEATLHELHACGMLKGKTQVIQEGSQTWQTFSEAFPDRKSQSPQGAGATEGGYPASPTGAEQRALGKKKVQEVGAKAGEVGLKAGALAGEMAGTTNLFLRRFLTSDFQKQQITPQEAEALDSANPPITGDVARNYLAWRRSLLWISGVTLTLTALFSLTDLKELGQDTPLIIWVTLGSLPLTRILAGVLALRAAFCWTRIQETRRMTRFCWICMFVFPFLVALVPIAPFLDGRDFNQQSKSEVGLMFGFAYLVVLPPLVFGLFSGLVRASLTLKTLLPESPMPGWIAVIVSPIFSLVFLILLIVCVQTQQFLLSIALGCMSIAPLILTWNTKSLTIPVSAEGLETGFRKARRLSRLFVTIGLIAFGLFLVTNYEMLDDMDLGILDVLKFITSFIASVLLVTVACSDLLLSLFNSSFKREAELRDSPLNQALSERLEEFEKLGLTELRAGEAELFDRVRNSRRAKNPSSEDQPGE